MATVNKDFKIKSGLIVEGTTGTINGENILTENASDQYIIDLIGGETLVTSVDSDQLQVVNGELSVKDNVFDVDGAAAAAETNANSYTDTALEDYTPTASLDTTVAGYGYAKTADLPTMYSDADAVDAVSAALGDGIEYVDGSFDVQFSSGITIGGGTGNELVIDRSEVDSWYDAAGAAADVATDLSTHEQATTGIHGVTGNVVGTSDSQTLSNKSIDGELSFGENGSSVEDSAGSLTVYAGDHLYLTSNGGDIVLNADGTVYIGSSSAGNEAATHSYVDNAVAGLAWKQAVNLLSTTHVDISGDLVGTSIDSHADFTTANNGYRILLTGQNTASQNGIYELLADGSVLNASRPADANTYDELVGAAVFVMEGTTYGASSWVQSNHYLTDFTGQTWTQFSGNGSVTAGNGIVVDGLEVSIDTDVVATQTDLSTGLGGKQDTLTAGNGIDITGDTISVAFDAGNGLAINGTNLTVDTNVIATKTYAEGVADTAEGNANDYTDTALQSYTTTASLETTIDGYGFAYTSELPTSTDDLTEGTAQYFTDSRAKASAASLLTGASLTNITITGDENGLTITAENGVADSTTDDLAEGEDNLYFTNTRVIDAIDNADITPNTVQIDTFRKEEATQTYFSSASTATVHSFGYPFGSVKYIVRVVGNVSGTTHSQVTEILATVDGNNNVAVTEFGSIHTTEPALASFTVDYDGGTSQFRLRATTVNAGSEVIVAATLLSWND